MANDITSFTAVGRLTRDAELRYTNSGIPLCKFSIASNYSRKVHDNWQEEVSYFDFTLFGKRAEALAQYLTKGQQVVVSGQLRQDRWEDNGEKRSRVAFFAQDVQLIGGKPAGQSNQQGQYGEAPYQGPPQNQRGGYSQQPPQQRQQQNSRQGQQRRQGPPPNSGYQKPTGGYDQWGYPINPGPNNQGPDQEMDFEDDIPF
ncbi:single-stranded DNA-binding protein [Sediminispirochaeta smaragdinae]|uniref:Single-stranded DNA-binding protein n=1 Tax=Sediminispirochaeta smaragdinae (strain DSM 11293 / JCM 15392 / SEBR 4228) TaxID=573413 RepID=E1R1F8_SEDSS|nr:single-stranded DNA-binding protein [Sediminispirochaeta smaragdinae]ADK81099.1 single-strand binding protein [Sediminispirochaeta smaragdinae DSM 11293]